MQDRNYPKVSIVSVNWNQVELTCIMLASLRHVSYPNVEVIVVDNGSTKGDPKTIKERFPEIKLILSDNNLGFAGGNNLAFPHITGKYVLLLNNDTEVDPHFLEPIIETMEKDDIIGIVSPKILFYDKPTHLQYAGTTLINPITSRGKRFGYDEEDKGQYDQARETGFANGACMMIRAQLLEELGHLYEDYFLYYEEHDFCERARKAGYRICFEPKSKIYHKVSASTGVLSPLKTYYQHRNRLLFMRRNTQGWTYRLGFLYYLLIATPKECIKYLLSLRFDNVRAIWRGTVWNLMHSGKPMPRDLSLNMHTIL